MRTMLNLATPWRHWPRWQHVVAAALALAALGVACLGAVRYAGASQQAQRDALEAAQRMLADLQGRRAALAVGDLSQHFAASASADDVARDIARFAESGRVQVQSLTVQAQAPTAREAGKVQFNVSAAAEYVPLKAWLAELTGRYPSLAVSTLSMRPVANEGARLTSSVSLILFIKD
jgi:Type II secretion system (T2SS), protein M subtype b